MGHREQGRALVVDDDPNVLGVLNFLLRKEGWEVRYALDAAAALAMFEKTRFDTVLADLDLPGMTGLELATAMRTLDSTVDIILVADAGRAPDTSAVAHAGIRHVLRKPFRLDALFECVGACPSRR